MQDQVARFNAKGIPSVVLNRTVVEENVSQVISRREYEHVVLCRGENLINTKPVERSSSTANYSRDVHEVCRNRYPRILEIVARPTFPVRNKMAGGSGAGNETKYIHTYICTYIHTYVHTYIHTYVHTYISM